MAPATPELDAAEEAGDARATRAAQLAADPTTKDGAEEQPEQQLGWCDRRVLAAGVIAGLGFGIGTSFGLFVAPITSALGLGREIVSLAVGSQPTRAIHQLSL